MDPTAWLLMRSLAAPALTVRLTSNAVDVWPVCWAGQRNVQSVKNVKKQVKIGKNRQHDGHPSSAKAVQATCTTSYRYIAKRT